MDRELAPEVVTRSRNKNLLVGVVVVVGLAVALTWARDALKTSVEAEKIRLATAEIGPVENTLDATGEVIPAFEQVITSPIRASIRRVLLTPGTSVKPGQPILDLDKSLTEIELEKIKDQLELKRNGIDQLRMKLTKSLYDAEVNDQIKQLNISKLRAELEGIRRLQKVGGNTAEDVTRSENALRVAELEKKQLENDLNYNRQSMGASLRETTLQAQIEEKNVKELQHKLKQADIVADRPGVLTWVNENIGSAVNEGEMLAKLADLASFRVEGSCSDVYADQVKVGLPVIVKVNETSLRGQITQVKPAVKNGIVQFVIQLDDNRHTSLRPNMKADVFIVTNRTANAVRVANGPAFKGKRKQFVYVLPKGEKVAHRREVTIGLSNFNFVEIKQGLQPGEQIILTDLSEYEHLEDITITPKR
ncbi:MULTISPECIES: HlyD family efflux transporter periplasmic adaptor subunit [unclassified Spirosoma]|uniref:efflux RND transporter periplasmic adaptor subunit n=1 Tax=unclassified Spirosoma TaxID=2621999 RepID=UPI000965F1DB|nr:MULTISPECIES: HlyD family efflux transporter periplasmic adaptor subunit [unclassified Spirosoma]MBN8826084.1 HlyD family efflux transporter periplasmic adaptor subunit [Spirosoma sp.]OJW74573.1 MAG: efflux transporter periplasmic adaptor subunit [Spirosoma sp. 48-14]